jgi:phosphatidylglycerophosphatase A
VKPWIAQGFGVGRIPFAPGTFGSVVGLLWFILLLSAGNIWIWIAGTAAGVAVSVWLCGAAERQLKKKDPPSVVLDEIAAIPVCFGSWVGAYVWKSGALPSPTYFFSKPHWLFTIGILAAFRLFDIWKPWPVRQSQQLPGGWGVTIDDILAAVYVAAVALTIQLSST